MSIIISHFYKGVAVKESWRPKTLSVFSYLESTELDLKARSAASKAHILYKHIIAPSNIHGSHGYTDFSPFRKRKGI